MQGTLEQQLGKVKSEKEALALEVSQLRDTSLCYTLDRPHIYQSDVGRGRGMGRLWKRICQGIGKAIEGQRPVRVAEIRRRAVG